MFISDIIIKIFTKHFLTIIYSKKSHVFALGPGLHKNALGLNTVKRTKIQKRKHKKKKEKKKKKKEINNKPTTKENNAAHIYTLQKSMLSAGNGCEGDSGDLVVWMESI